MKNPVIRAATVGALAILFSACSGMQGGQGEDESAEASKPAFEQAYQAAEASYNKAKATNNLWVNTEEEMDKAKEAASKGDYAKAIKLAKNIQFESDLAYEQYQSQKDIKPWLF